MSKEKTKEEMRDMFIDQVKFLSSYWSKIEGKTDREKCDGLAFSIMNIFDGTCGGFPCAVDLVMRPHPDDKDFMINEGEDYVLDGQVINDDCHLHELICK